MYVVDEDRHEKPLPYAVTHTDPQSLTPGREPDLQTLAYFRERDDAMACAGHLTWGEITGLETWGGDGSGGPAKAA